MRAWPIISARTRSGRALHHGAPGAALGAGDDDAHGQRANLGAGHTPQQTSADPVVFLLSHRQGRSSRI